MDMASAITKRNKFGKFLHESSHDSLKTLWFRSSFGIWRQNTYISCSIYDPGLYHYVSFFSICLQNPQSFSLLRTLLSQPIHYFIAHHNGDSREQLLSFFYHII